MSGGHQANCECRSGERWLAVLTKNLAREFPELMQFAEESDWQFHAELDTLIVPIGREAPTSSLAEFVNFIRGLLELSRLGALRATWLEMGRDIKEQLSRLIHATPLVGMAPVDSAPLLDILYSSRIETWFQPVRRAADNSIWGYECLLRGRTETGELINPLDLIEWARRENLIFMLDRMARETHLHNAGKLIADLDNTHVLINYLPSSIYRPEFCLLSTGMAAVEAGIPARQIIFEVVETEKITDMAHLNSVLNHYRKVGYQVALDDVGSGYSSLEILGDLNPDLIKIDMALIQRARTSTLHADICRSLVELGQKRQRLVLAEGIELEEDREFAVSIGADLLQGYLLGRPDPVPATV